MNFGNGMNPILNNNQLGNINQINNINNFGPMGNFNFMNNMNNFNNNINNNNQINDLNNFCNMNMLNNNNLNEFNNISNNNNKNNNYINNIRLYRIIQNSEQIDKYLCEIDIFDKKGFFCTISYEKKKIKILITNFKDILEVNTITIHLFCPERSIKLDLSSRKKYLSR